MHISWKILMRRVLGVVRKSRKAVPIFCALFHFYEQVFFKEGAPRPLFPHLVCIWILSHKTQNWFDPAKSFSIVIGRSFFIWNVLESSSILPPVPVVDRRTHGVAEGLWGEACSFDPIHQVEVAHLVPSRCSYPDIGLTVVEHGASGSNDVATCFSEKCFRIV